MLLLAMARCGRGGDCGGEEEAEAVEEVVVVAGCGGNAWWPSSAKLVKELLWRCILRCGAALLLLLLESRERAPRRKSHAKNPRFCTRSGAGMINAEPAVAALARAPRTGMRGAAGPGVWMWVWVLARARCFLIAFGFGASTALHIGHDRPSLPSATSCVNHDLMHDLWNSWLQHRMEYVVGRLIDRFFPSGVDVSCSRQMAQGSPFGIVVFYSTVFRRNTFTKECARADDASSAVSVFGWCD